MYEAVIPLTLQLLYYRSWVSIINYTHGQPYYGKLHTRTAVLWKAIFSVLKLVTHTHPTIPNMFISLLKVDQALGSIYEAEIHCINESTHDE